MDGHYLAYYTDGVHQFPEDTFQTCWADVAGVRFFWTDLIHKTSIYIETFSDKDLLAMEEAQRALEQVLPKQYR